MNVQLKKLRLSYFKGIKSLEMDFEAGENFIHGKNASGKTTVFDSLWFLFFGKDSTGRADFSIKTLDAKNRPIEKVDHEVYAQFKIGAETKSFQRTFKQIWSKEGVLKGHTTDYEIDGYPVRLESDYRKEVEAYFKEELFKLLTNPLFFNSMKPAERRSALLSLATEITADQVFGSMPAKQKKSKHIIELETLLTQGKSIDQIKAKAAMDKKNLKEEKESIPDRIDEAERSKPEAFDPEELADLIAGKKAELEAIEAEIKQLSSADTAHNAAVQQWQNRLFEAKTKLQKLEFQADQELAKWKNEADKFPREIQGKIKDANNEAVRLEAQVKDITQTIERKKASKAQLEGIIPQKQDEKAKLVGEWKAEDAKEFHWDGTNCPSCSRPLEGTQALDAKQQAEAKFNKAKIDRKQEIEQRGLALKNQIEEYQSQVARIDEEIRTNSITKQQSEALLVETQDELTNLNTAVNEYYANPREDKTVADFLSPEAKTLKADIQKLEAEKPEKTEAVDTSELEANKKAIQNGLEELQKALGNSATIERINKRIAELKQKESDLAQAITDAEGMEEACFAFSKARVELIEAEINAKFSLVSFKLFEIQLNGNEKEVCETLLNGVPFNDLNNAGKIQAGLDIINTLSRHYDLYLPIFIDNRESVTWIPEVQSQLVNLVVNEEVNELLITPGKMKFIKPKGLVQELINEYETIKK